MALSLPFNVPQAVQAVIATLAVIGSAGNALLQAWHPFLPADWSVAITAGLAAIAGVSGFLQKAEPLIEDLT